MPLSREELWERGPASVGPASRRAARGGIYYTSNEMRKLKGRDGACGEMGLRAGAAEDARGSFAGGAFLRALTENEKSKNLSTPGRSPLRRIKVKSANYSSLNLPLL